MGVAYFQRQVWDLKRSISLKITQKRTIARSKKSFFVNWTLVVGISPSVRWNQHLPAPFRVNLSRNVIQKKTNEYRVGPLFVKKRAVNVQKKTCTLYAENLPRVCKTVLVFFQVVYLIQRKNRFPVATIIRRHGNRYK